MPGLQQRVVASLIEDIVQGTYPPGSLLPDEAELARQFGVPRRVARECVRELEARGLVATDAERLDPTSGRPAAALPGRETG